MADSENSRTAPTISSGKKGSSNQKIKTLPHVINRRNLLPVAGRVLQDRIASIPPRTVSGQTPVREIWLRWWDLFQQRVRASRLRKNLESRLLKEMGGHPSVEIDLAESDQPVIVRTYSEINAIAPRLEPDQTARAKASLRQRRRAWNSANRRLGYSAALTKEQETAFSEGIAGRVLLLTPPSSLVEVAAKLHCLLVMQDPDLKLKDEPWPQLRRMLKELIRPELSET
ncbi:hypothetical protein LAV84_29930 [Rhizobium sp. VS19-DR104.2]|uniref:hypothetical protein n=1 Tax=unclassified Rhizobium TaxID=2613769 RepID=UPI001C5AE850|nr:MULTISPECIES: hypothetical protein [unclassified Rhizobium]MBZ5763674.1 hypothetical protein [Rhizobium sp. VS19-DR96]MBZ5769598.1 hypothetical protein [Rhizobium sp. VS19-DR129.2]MBZ5777027.1 hypothetical protein [Rhizobium sp. VS19-DRK62.2]MBZ5788118.1 hypothetical protein [Rhizobium sp. VS19-DR121]MBZ5805738.1 hypothetical protein [Rhizobium sp. VS19-DR181]